MNFEKPVFLIQNNYFDRLGRLIQPCLDFCHANGHDFIDRSLTDEFDPDTLGVDWSKWPGVILYGSVGWVKRCRQSSLALWAFYDPDAFAASTWVPIFGEEALNGDGFVTDLLSLERRLVGDSHPRFHVRPDRDDKAFVGGVYDWQSWAEMADKRRRERQSKPASDLACFVSPVKEILAEHRCWFVDGVLIDISTYRRSGSPQVERCLDLSIAGEAQRLGDIYLPVKSVVMDIAETPTGCKVIEFNPINSSGWYAADVDGLFWAMSDMIRRGRAPGQASVSERGANRG
ncbi:hypothetical protein D3C71_188660 [compost metagenome]